MNGFIIAFVIIVVVITSIASQKQKKARQGAAQQPEPNPVESAPMPRVTERKPLQPMVAQHVVSPSFASGHAHQETSMSGDVPCAPVPDHAVVKIATSAPYLDCSEAQRGIVYAEILGKPRALQKRR